jgi:hypothetical protein
MVEKAIGCLSESCAWRESCVRVMSFGRLAAPKSCGRILPGGQGLRLCGMGKLWIAL